MNDIAQLKPKDVWRVMQENPAALLIDVRDAVERTFVGYPVGSLHVPWKVAPAWKQNPRFLEQVGEFAPDKGRPLFLLCRSGQRSLDAARSLAAAGYSRLTNVEEGFEGPLDEEKHRGTAGGWRYHGLPWEQS